MEVNNKVLDFSLVFNPADRAAGVQNSSDAAVI
jgi:hypothetical protein